MTTDTGAPVAAPAVRDFKESHTAGDTGVPALQDLIAFAYRYRFVIGSTLIVAAALAGFFIWSTPPSFTATALIQVEHPRTDPLAETPMPFFFRPPEAKGEGRKISTRGVVHAVIEKKRLRISAAPRHFPLIGEPLWRRFSPESENALALPPIDLQFLKQYAWGGERIEVGLLEAPEDVSSIELTVVAKGDNRFSVLDEEGQLISEGEVGENVNLPGEGGEVVLRLAELRGRPGTEFVVELRSLASMTRKIRGALAVKEAVPGTGLVDLAYVSRDRKQAAELLNAIINEYLEQSVQRQAEDAETMLEFIDSQIPEFKGDLEQAEQALQDYHVSSGGTDVSREGETLLSKLSSVSVELSRLELEKFELRQRYKGDHPLLITLNRKLSELRAKEAELNEAIKTLPSEEWDMVQLERDLHVAQELYTLLLNRSQELRIAKAGRIGNISIIDYAVAPDRKSAPRTPRIIVVALMLGMIAGVGIALLLDATNRSVDDPDYLEQRFGIPVQAVVPHSSEQQRIAKQLKSAKRRGGLPPELGVLSLRNPEDSSLESLRALRTNLQFSLLANRQNVLAVVGPTPQIGKSFLSLNIATLFSELGLRVVLLDADMRRGHLHSFIGQKRSPGLSEILSQGRLVDETVQQINENTHLITSGAIPPNPGALVSGPTYERLLAELREKYDVVIVDTPPVLSVAEGISLARQADASVLVVHSDNTQDEVEVAVRRLNYGQVSLHGIALNDVRAQRRGDRYGRYSYYTYAYKKYAYTKSKADS